MLSLVAQGQQPMVHRTVRTDSPTASHYSTKLHQRLAGRQPIALDLAAEQAIMPLLSIEKCCIPGLP